MSGGDDDLAWLAAALGLDGDEAAAEAVWMATLWADHLVAIARFGYPKDNHLPPPIAERLGDRSYTLCVIEALVDAGDGGDEGDEDDEDDEDGGAARRGEAALRHWSMVTQRD